MQRHPFAVLSWVLLSYHLQSFGLVDGHREHKVHNIVLYPDKHSWCTTFPIKQVISYPGCKSEEIDNNVCVGACFSYSIPHTEPSDPGEVIVPYCDSCQPSDTTWHNVTLGCNKETCDTPHLVKSVQIINNCSCTSCDKSLTNRDGNNLNDDTEFSTTHNDVPELLNVLSLHNDTNITSTFKHDQNVRHLMDHKIIALLQNIQAKNSPHDKAQLIELLSMMKGPEYDFSDEAIAEFVETLSDEHIELDMAKLKELLHQLEHKQKHNHDKHKKYNHNSDKKHHDHHYHAAAAAGDLVDHGEHLKSTHHTAGGHLTSAGDSDSDEDAGHDQIAPLGSEEAPHHHPAGHHVVGESLGHGHLIKGPRGALVIDPGHNHGHEKLDVNPHELKPNTAGTMVSYANPSSSSSQKNKINND